VSRIFAPPILKTLTRFRDESTRQELSGPVSEAGFRSLTQVLEAADITPDRMRKALRESKRAEPKEISTLQWARQTEGTTDERRKQEQ
jgi:hypothetical protein